MIYLLLGILTLLSSCVQPTGVETPKAITMEVVIMSDVYRNDPGVHVPDWAIGKWKDTESGQITEFASDGINAPVSTILFPNPITPQPFLESGGSSFEDAGEERYFIEAKTSGFVYKGKTYGGSFSYELIASEESFTLNGRVVEKM